MSEPADDADPLRVSEERHRLLAEQANDVIWTMGLDGSITYVSPAVERMRGITQAEAMSQTLDQIHPPESQAVSLAYFTRLYEEMAAGRAPEEFRGELEYYRKDGSTVWTEVQVIPHIAPDGQVVEILGVTRDISDRKRHEEELRQARGGSLGGLASANVQVRASIHGATDGRTLARRRPASQRGRACRRGLRSGDPSP